MKQSKRSWRIGIAVLAAAATLGVGAPAAWAADGDAALEPAPATTLAATPAPAADQADSWQAKLDAANDGDTVTLSGTIADSLVVKKKITITAAEGTVFTGSLRINASGVTVKGVTFTLDPATNKNAQNVIVSNKATGVTITGNTFVIAAGDPATGASQNKDWQPSSVWLEGGANGTVISGNTFKLGQVVNNSAVGVNIVGNGTNPISGTKIENNTVTAGPISGNGASGSMMFVVGNGNTAAGSYGITDTTVTGNTVKNATGLSADKSRVYGVAVTATKNTTISSNTIEGYLAVSYSVWPSQGPNDGVTISGNTLDSYAGVFLGDKVTEKGLTVKGNTFGENTQIPVVDQHANAAVTDQDGVAYGSVAAALAAGATTVTLLHNVAEDVTIAAGKTVTIDLNGYTLTNKTADTIVNNGTLTVTDSSAKKTGVVDNVTHGKAAVKNTIGATATLDGGTFRRSKEAGSDPKNNGGNSFYTLQNMGTMTINDGVTVESKLADGTPSKFSSVIANGFYNGIKDNPDEKTAELTINGGTITGGLYIKNDEYGKLTVNGGTITGTSAAVLNYGTDEIAGGTLTATNDKARVVWNIRIDKSATSAPGKLTVSGGTITATGSQTAIYQDQSQGTGAIAITGGTVQGPISQSDADADAADAGFAISGGTFTVKPDAGYLADGYEVTENADGTFGVKKTTPEQPTKPENKPEANKPASKPANKLSATGSSVLQIAVAAIALLAVAGGMTAVSRKRR
ncbi:cell adhesion protein [Bifidobacterium stellenboschense]|uniref:Cell adhesion protein n=2 Tax=Bifidobacterium stellenboschense TaxID=762211 RepID=A0A087DN44_9BIFI|nr:cell adhesion protein [Bifidobacterium stellenboschense]